MTSLSPALLEPIEVLEGLPRAFSSPGWNDLFEVQSWSEKLSLSQYSKEHPKTKPWKRRGWERTRDRRKGMSWDRADREKTGCHHLQWNTAQHRPPASTAPHRFAPHADSCGPRKRSAAWAVQGTEHSGTQKISSGSKMTGNTSFFFIISSLGHRLDKVWCFSNFRASSVQQQELTVKGTRYFPQLCTSPKKSSTIKHTKSCSASTWILKPELFQPHKAW